MITDRILRGHWIARSLVRRHDRLCQGEKLGVGFVRPVLVMPRAVCFAPRVPFSRSRQSICPRSQCRRALAPSWHYPQADRFWATEGGDSFSCPFCEYALAAVPLPAASASRWTLRTSLCRN